jgi:pimeloyl-ACP methyl ester carboxylesterase
VGDQGAGRRPVRRSRLFRIAAVLTAVVVIPYLAAIGYLSWNEHAYVFLPAERTLSRPPAHLRLAEEEVSFPSTDGVSISAWVIPSSSQPTGMWMLICHGNFGNIGFGRRPEFYSFMRGVGVNLLAFDYRGYGQSTGQPREQGLYDDTRAAYEYLVRNRGVRPDRILIFGHSLGSAMAIELASHVPAAGLIVEGAFTSVVDRAQELYPLFPISLISTQRFVSIDRVQSIEMPKLFLHSPEDVVIPLAHGKRLFQAARPPKRFVSVRGGHDDAYRIDRTVYFGAIADLIALSQDGMTSKLSP